MLRRASEIFQFGSDQKNTTVKARLAYVSAERHNLRKESLSASDLDGKSENEGEQDSPSDSLDFDLKWCITDNTEDARKQKVQALNLGKARHTFEHVTVQICSTAAQAVEGEAEGEGQGQGEGQIGKVVSVTFKCKTEEPRLSKVTFEWLGTESPSLHLVLDEEEISDIQHVCIHEGAQVSFFKWLGIFSIPFTSLTKLDCSYCGITTFPESIVNLSSQLRSLNLNYNKLQEMPDKVISKLLNLEKLEARNNLLSSLPASLSTLMQLHTLNLEDNKLTSIICPFNKLKRLRTLRLKGNSLLYLPPLVGNATLQELSVANIVIKGNIRKAPAPEAKTGSHSAHHLKYEDVTTTFSESAATSFLSPLKSAVGTQQNKWIPFFDLFVGRSEAHPLVLAAILQALEDKEACKYVAVQERGVLQQLVLLTLSNDVDVVQRSSQCLISAFSKCDIMDRLLENNMQQCVCTLLGSNKTIDQEAGIKLLSHIAYTSDQFSSAIFNNTILTLLASIAAQNATPIGAGARVGAMGSAQENLELCGKAMECLGNVALSLENREKLVRNKDLLRAIDTVIALKSSSSSADHSHSNSSSNSPDRSPRAQVESERENERRLLAIAVRCAVRVLAILGLNEQVDRALGINRGSGGVRVLSIDGGGAKGRCALEFCRVIQQKTGKKISELFDLIVGTSTGSIIAIGIGTLDLSIDEVEAAYDMLTKAFRSASEGSSGSPGWIEQMSGLYNSSTQNIRALFRGCLYNHEILENFYKKWTRVPDMMDVTTEEDERFCAFSKNMINLAPLAGRPRVGCLSSLTNCARPLGYMLRTYEFPPDANGLYKRSMSRSTRRSSAAPATELKSEPMSVGMEGTSTFTLWQTLRASTAAPLYVEGYVHEQTGLFLQDGALCSNNPVVVAFQEAAAIWPERRVDVIVSLGNGVPKHELKQPKQKTMMETIATIAESCTSVDRDHVVMESLVSYLNNNNMAKVGGAKTNACKYFRFQPDDSRCDIMLDETNELKLQKLKDAYTEYIQANEEEFELACQALMGSSCNDSGCSDSSAAVGNDANCALPSPPQGNGNGFDGRYNNSNSNGVIGGDADSSSSESKRKLGGHEIRSSYDDGVLVVQDSSSAFPLKHQVNGVYDACMANEKYKLRVCTSEQLVRAASESGESRGACVSEAEVSMASRYANHFNARSLPAWVHSTGSQLMRCLRDAFLIHLECLALDRKGLVAEWLAEEPFTVMEKSSDSKQLLLALKERFLSTCLESESKSTRETLRETWVCRLQKVSTLREFFRMKGNSVMPMEDYLLVYCGGNAAELRMSTSIPPVSLSTLRRLRPLERFRMNQNIHGKVVGCSYPLPKDLVSEWLPHQPLAIICPRPGSLEYKVGVNGSGNANGNGNGNGSGVDEGAGSAVTSSAPALDTKVEVSHLMHLLYSKMLQTRDAAASWSWLRDNYDEAEQQLSVCIP